LTCTITSRSAWRPDRRSASRRARSSDSTASGGQPQVGQGWALRDELLDAVLAEEQAPPDRQRAVGLHGRADGAGVLRLGRQEQRDVARGAAGIRRGAVDPGVDGGQPGAQVVVHERQR